MKEQKQSYWGRMALLTLSGSVAIMGCFVLLLGVTQRDVADILFGGGLVFLGAGMVFRDFEAPVWVVRALVIIGMVAFGVNILILMGR